MWYPHSGSGAEAILAQKPRATCPAILLCVFDPSLFGNASGEARLEVQTLPAAIDCLLPKIEAHS
jgi:hypothetical protein